MRHTISLSLLLSIIWLANSGHYNGLLLSLGALSVALVVWICHRMDVVDHESQPVHLTRNIPRYYGWLAWQILLSNIDVVKRIWRGNASIDPQMKTLPVAQKTDLGRVIYANSINLTPGTLAVELDDDTVLVHALTSANINDLETGEMSRRACELEK
ncbi:MULTISPECIES: Na+/H+ antiporter subunit E [Spongiibacter]|jgi:multicomponent Na+:H+ antiporter subunit E|uniref:Na+/H+ antiporter subunit E n=1 Tax=Spongiibacter TaxID=630749 RepID=UPI000C665931|nr:MULTISPECIES: Na+/H+ antiporter subunit E [Spongiibacter]MAY40553.1 cation transporter [Spongiibacter sp.]MBO6753489.1 Na+/H+ antiporter subunit E [Spongiibacter sp.]|tara:strand:+ start:8161 stop:8631 length:471 start_codon:yes stop_codon:yes gene_type:complete